VLARSTLNKVTILPLLPFGLAREAASI